MHYERILQTHAVSMKHSFAKKEPLIIFDQLLKIKKSRKDVCDKGIVCFFTFYHLEKEKERKKIIIKDF